LFRTRKVSRGKDMPTGKTSGGQKRQKGAASPIPKGGKPPVPDLISWELGPTNESLRKKKNRVKIKKKDTIHNVRTRVKRTRGEKG